MKDFQEELCVEGVADRFRRALVKSGSENAMNYDLNTMRFGEVIGMCVVRDIDIQPMYMEASKCHHAE